MRQVIRLLRYAIPFMLQLLPGVLLLAAVGLLEAFRLILVKPVLDRVLNPASGSDNIWLFTVPGTDHVVYLQQFVPTRFHNAWTVVAFALVASTILKGIFDYAGTYLVNHAGFGMITDLRNDLYESVLHRSAAFFQKNTTGTLVSTIVNDIERVQYAMSSVLAEFRNRARKAVRVSAKRKNMALSLDWSAIARASSRSACSRWRSGGIRSRSCSSDMSPS